MEQITVGSTWKENTIGLFEKSGRLIVTSPDGFCKSDLCTGDSVTKITTTVTVTGFRFSRFSDQPVPITTRVSTVTDGRVLVDMGSKGAFLATIG